MQSAQMHATVVFDSNAKEAAHYPTKSQAYPNLEILFSPKGLCADKYILEYLEGHSRPSSLILVTDDRTLTFFAKETGVRHSSITDFLQKLQKKSTHKPSESKPRSLPSKEFDRLLQIFEERFKQNDQM